MRSTPRPRSYVSLCAAFVLSATACTDTPEQLESVGLSGPGVPELQMTSPGDVASFDVSTVDGSWDKRPIVHLVTPSFWNATWDNDSFIRGGSWRQIGHMSYRGRKYGLALTCVDHVLAVSWSGEGAIEHLGTFDLNFGNTILVALQGESMVAKQLPFEDWRMSVRVAESRTRFAEFPGFRVVSPVWNRIHAPAPDSER